MTNGRSQFESLQALQNYFINVVMNSMNREQPGNYLRKLLGNGTGMSTWTSTTLQNCKRQDKVKTKVLNNLLIVARVSRKR